MLDTKAEPLLTLAEASAVVRKHIATVYRWSTIGYRGVVLETIQVGGTRCTTHEAIQRFCERLTAVPRAPGRRGKAGAVASQKAAKELEGYGI